MRKPTSNHIVDLDKVHAAMVAGYKIVAEPVLEYARMMHEAHGTHVKTTADFGLNNNVTPVATSGVKALQEKHAAELSEIVLLEGVEFGRAYFAFEVKAHTDAQDLIDESLAMTSNEQVKNHLIQTREMVTMHLQQTRHRVRACCFQSARLLVFISWFRIWLFSL